MKIDGEMVQALEDLVAAHDRHTAAAEAFLAYQAGADTEQFERLADALERAQLRVGDEATNVAILARQRGIKSSMED